MRKYGLLAVLLLMLGMVSARNRQNFDEGWRFVLADSVQMALTAYDDSRWRLLDLPHDWAIEGDFLVSNPSGAGGGALPGGIGWYRKHLYIDKDKSKNQRWFIDFDGVYMNSTVYLNGHKLGFRPYGYSSFRYELTPYLASDGDNVIAVRVDNSDQPNSRWYSGCGIYRHVWVTQTTPISIAHWGTYVSPTVQADGSARFDIAVTLENTLGKATTAKVRNTLYAADGKKVTSVEKSIVLKAFACSQYKAEDNELKKTTCEPSVLQCGSSSVVVCGASLYI